MIEYLKKNVVDAVFTYEISRVGRTFFDTMDAIRTIDTYAPFLPCSHKEAFLATTDKSFRNLLLGILSWIAERERELISENYMGSIQSKSRRQDSWQTPESN
jgi:putative DNA-invertase from lambdoid prophage Rac